MNITVQFVLHLTLLFASVDLTLRREFLHHLGEAPSPDQEDLHESIKALPLHYDPDDDPEVQSHSLEARNQSTGKPANKTRNIDPDGDDEDEETAEADDSDGENELFDPAASDSSDSDGESEAATADMVDETDDAETIDETANKKKKKKKLTVVQKVCTGQLLLRCTRVTSGH